MTVRENHKVTAELRKIPWDRGEGREEMKSGIETKKCRVNHEIRLEKEKKSLLKKAAKD